MRKRPLVQKEGIIKFTEFKILSPITHTSVPDPDPLGSVTF